MGGDFPMQLCCTTSISKLQAARHGNAEQQLTGDMGWHDTGSLLLNKQSQATAIEATLFGGTHGGSTYLIGPTALNGVCLDLQYEACRI